MRYSVPGDRARLRADGVVELLGRDSVTINSGGEKIFAEEVEAGARATTPPCTTSSCAGRPSERWGNEVVAIVQLRDGHDGRPTTTCSPRRERHIARYKLPKAFVFVDEVVRSPVRQGRLPLGPHHRRQLSTPPLSTRLAVTWPMRASGVPDALHCVATGSTVSSLA